MASEQLISFDYAMKYILRDKSDYSIIEGFLSALLATAGYKPVKVKALLETESNKDEARGKRIVADMVVEDTDGVNFIIVISIPAFHNEINRSIDEWLYMMKNESIKDNFKEKYIKLAAERLSFLKMSAIEQTNYMRYQLEMVDVKEEIRTAELKAEAKGRAEGIAEGEYKKTLEIAQRLKATGLSHNQIADITGLSLIEINKI